jgi:hypothetical protein
MAARRAGIAALALALLASGAQARAVGPTLTAQPTIAGTVEVGSRLVAGSGTWSSSSTVTFAYQWYRCDPVGAHCSSIHGATGPGLTLSRKDAGHTIGLTVTATDSGGATPSYASLAGPVAAAKPLLVSTAQPQVTGLPVAGKPLQVTTGAWSPVPASVTYSWLRCNANGRVCAAIAGATSSTYTVSGADVGHALVALVQAAFGRSTQGALSTATAAAIGGDVTGPTHSAPPAITGVAELGAQLTASAGVWTGVGSLTYHYQWYRCDADGAHCMTIRGATKPTYRTARADPGKTLAFTVRATDSTGTAAAYSSLVGPIAPRHASIASSTAPALSGSAAPGATLTADAGSWLPPAGAVSYAWRRCNPNGRLCVPIADAAKPAYAVTAADVGHVIVAVVTATIGATTQPAYSTASPRVA